MVSELSYFNISVPNEKGIKKKVGAKIEEFKSMVFPDGYVPGAKRRAPAGGGAAKKIKIDIPVDVEAEAKAGRVCIYQGGPGGSRFCCFTVLTRECNVFVIYSTMSFSAHKQQYDYHFSIQCQYSA